MAVDQLRYGTWVDIIEDIETPMTMLPLEYITATAGLAAGASVVATRETSSIPAVTSPTSSTQKAIQHSVSLHKSVSAAATSSASDIVTTTGTGTSMNSFTGHSHDAVTASKSSMVLRNGEMERLAKKETRSRTALMAAAAVGGGVIIGVSAGLAAPMVGRLRNVGTLFVLRWTDIFTPHEGAGIGALLTAVKIAGTTSFLTGVGGTALITSAGVITGSSIAGSKMAKRTAGIEVFRFIPINESERRNVIISVSGWVTSKKSKSSAVLKGGNDGGGARSRSASAASNRSKDERDGVSASTSKADGASKDDSTGEADKTAEGMETAEGDDADEILATGLDDLVVPFMGVSPLMGSHYALCFDPHILCGLGVCIVYPAFALL